MAEHLNQETFDAFVAQSASPALVDSSRAGGAPCRRGAPRLSKAGAEYEGRLEIARVNIDQNPTLAQERRIEAAPTLLLLRGGQEIGRHRGAIDKDTLKAFIEAAL